MKKSSLEKFVLCQFVLLFTLVIGDLLYVSYATDAFVESVVVNKLERVCSGTRSCEYLVFTDGEVFSNSDVILRGKFNSSDLYGKIKEGETYNLKVIGYRLNFLSRYRNILSIE